MKEKREYIEEVKKILKDHRYTMIASGDNCEVWHCGKPESSIFAFDIMVSRYGIAVVGDIDGLLFNVGSRYGIPFLAGDDVSYYIKSKLQSVCKEKEFSHDKLKEKITSAIYSHFEGDFDKLEEAGVELPGWLNTNDYDDHFDDMKAFLQSMVVTNILDNHDDLEVAIDLMDDAESVDNIYEGYEMLQDSKTIEFEMCDVDIEVSTENLMFRLYLVNEAAKQIMALKSQQEAT